MNIENIYIKKSLIIFRFCSIHQYDLNLSHDKQIELFLIDDENTIYNIYIYQHIEKSI